MSFANPKAFQSSLFLEWSSYLKLYNLRCVVDIGDPDDLSLRVGQGSNVGVQNLDVGTERQFTLRTLELETKKKKRKDEFINKINGIIFLQLHQGERNPCIYLLIVE